MFDGFSIDSDECSFDVRGLVLDIWLMFDGCSLDFRRMDVRSKFDRL